MNLKILYYKIFKRNQVIRTIYFDHAKRVHVIYALPKKKRFNIGEDMYEINQEDFFLMGNIPTYLHRAGRIEPINPFDSDNSVMAEDYYNVAINSELAKDAFKKQDENDESKLLMGAVFIMAILLIGLGVFVYLQFEELFELIQPIIPETPGDGGGGQ